LEILDNERLVLERIDEFVRKHNVPCDFNLTTTFDVCMSSDFAAHEVQNFEAVKRAGGNLSHVHFYDGEEARRQTGVKDAITAYGWPAGSIHPGKLCHWLLSSVIENGGRLFTHCPVSMVTRVSDAADARWKVSTPRGAISTPTVIHCNNANASLLLSQLEPHLKPNRAQAHSLIAPSGLSGKNTLSNTYSLRYSLKNFYSLFQRHGDGTLLLGVSRLNPNLSTDTLRSCLTYDDSGYNEEILEDALNQWNVIFPDEDKYIGPKNIHGEGLDHVWTGIIGMSGDSVPFVGQVGGMEGQYICAGFGGHG
jgi:glycine/D-amino acid oxidase-like deaminating enzyme